MNQSRYGPHQGHGQQPHRRDDRPSASQEVVQVNFYLDNDKRRLNPELLDKEAERQAELLREEINSAQVRRFFGDVKNLYLRLEQRRPWSEIEPQFRLIKSKAFYAASKGRAGKIPEEFKMFLVKNIDKVQDEKDFRAFVLYFEAVLGFMYGKGLVSK